MNKLSRQLQWLVYGVIVIALTSCTPKQGISPDELMKWNQATLNGDYERVGRHDPKWDKDAADALARFAEIRTRPEDDLETRSDLVGMSAASAVDAGCTDPLVRYLCYRYGPRSTDSPAQWRENCLALARDMDASGYSPLRKFYVDLYAAGWAYQRTNRNSWSDLEQLWTTATGNLIQVIQDHSVPDGDMAQACRTLFDSMEGSSSYLTNTYNSIDGSLFKSRPRQASSYLVKAEFYLQYAWIGRGHGTADQVTDEEWQLFRTRLEVADKALRRAQALDPKNPEVPVLMISVIEGKGGKRPEMEKRFALAMQSDPNNYQACRGKLHYLYPQWYGSRDEMLAFGRECVASTNWGGRVPLTLVDAHSEFDRFLETRDDRNAYWLQPDVWPDIKAAYEKYAQVNPDATRFRYPYAAYAFRCGQWQAFNDQIDLIRKTGDPLNYRYFGGKDEFDKMAEFIKEQTGEKTGP